MFKLAKVCESGTPVNWEISNLKRNIERSFKQEQPIWSSHNTKVQLGVFVDSFTCTLAAHFLVCLWLFGLRVQDTGRSITRVSIDGPARLEAVGRPNRMGSDTPWPSSQSGEVASGNEDRSGDNGGGRWRRSSQQGGVPKPSGNRRLNPDEALNAARARVSHLEAALGVLGESDSTEAQILRDALKQARRSAQEQPISAQIKDTEEFIARSTNRLQVLAQKRSEEEQLLKDATARLARLRELEAGPVCHPTALDVQVAELKAKLAVMEAERDARDAEMRGSPSVVDPDSQDPVPKRPCRREEFIPNCDEEMQEWMEDRHKDLQAAMVAGHLPEVARVSHLLTKAAQEWQQLIQQQSMMPSAVANSVR